MDFLALESQGYTLGMDDAFHLLYSPQSDSRQATCTKIAEKLLTVLVTLGERPQIRFKRAGPGCADNAERVARSLESALDAFEKQAGGHNPWWRPSKSAPTTLLILDRADDPLSPLVHEYSYQAMIYDLLEVHQPLVLFAHSSLSQA